MSYASRWSVGLIGLLLLSNFAVAGNAHQFPKPNGPADPLPTTYGEKKDAPAETAVYFTTDDHFEMFTTTRGNLISSKDPLFLMPYSSHYARFVPDMPKAYLVHTRYWENLWSFGVSGGQTLKKSVKLTYGSSRESVQEVSRSITGSVEVNYGALSASISATLSSMERLTLAITEQREETEEMEFTAAPTEDAVFTMWQLVDKIEIVDQNGQPIHYDSVWRIFNNDAAEWQATAGFHSPPPLIVRGQKFLDKASIPRQ